MEQDAIKNRQEEIDKLYPEWFPAEEHQKPKAVPGGVSTMDDQRLIDKACAAVNGDKFQGLYNGDISGHESPSEADLAFCSLLAFWTNRDPVQMDRILRASGLMREKWDKVHNGAGDTYGRMTIQKAINGCTEAFRDQQVVPKMRQPAPKNDNQWQIITLEDVYVQEIEDRPIVEGLIHEDDPTVIHAMGGVGKSLVIQDFFMTAGSGLSELWGMFPIPDAVASVMIQSENSRKAVHSRSRLKCEGNPDLIRGLQNTFYVGQYNNIQVAGYVSDEVFRQKLVDFCKRVEDEYQIKVAMIGFDPLISYHDKDENENSAMRTTLDHILNDIAVPVKATPIVIHHDNRAGEIRGASAIRDWARNIIKLERYGYRGEPRISFKHEKSNNFKLFDPFTLKMDEYLNFSPLDEVERMPAAKRKRCEQVREALIMMGRKATSKKELAAQYEEVSGVANRSTQYNHINEAALNGFISHEEYRDGNLTKNSYHIESE